MSAVVSCGFLIVLHARSIFAIFAWFLLLSSGGVLPLAETQDEKVHQTVVTLSHEGEYLFRDPKTNLQYMRRQDWAKYDETSLLSSSYAEKYNYTKNWRHLSPYESELWTYHSRKSFQHIYSTGKWGFGREQDEFDILYGHEWEFHEGENQYRRKKQLYARHSTDNSDPVHNMGTAGSGSLVEYTTGLRRQLERLLGKLFHPALEGEGSSTSGKVKFFDFACGDMLWATQFVTDWNGKRAGQTGLELEQPQSGPTRPELFYIGMEIAPAEAERHQRKFATHPHIHVINGDFTNLRFYRNFTEIAHAVDPILIDLQPRPAKISNSLLFIRDALQHVSLVQSCRFFLNVYRWHRENPLLFRYLLMGGYKTGIPNTRNIPTPGATENDPTEWPFVLPGLQEVLLEEDAPETLSFSEHVVARIASKKLFLYDVSAWAGSGGDGGNGFDPCPKM
ncbi:unnamed protein product [Amoebophrya sp. A120]|nr:unnamed protein product [Amoebophrya sp. A120]|eukprot:GSA120T00003748001.1